MENKSIEIRTVFTKIGRAGYISHLDLMRCMQRALKRSGLPIWYTEGFNPHSYIMFPLALSLGISSECEVMDFSLNESVPFDEIKERLNKTLPEGLQIVSVSFPIYKHTAIAAAEYRIKMLGDNVNQLAGKFNEFIQQDKIEVLKRTKKKIMTTVDIKSGIEVLFCEIVDEQFLLDLKLTAGVQQGVNVNVVIEAFRKYISEQTDNCADGQEFFTVKIERRKIVCENGEKFS